MKYGKFFFFMLLLVLLSGLSSLLSPGLISYWNQQGIPLGKKEIFLLLALLLFSLALELLLTIFRERFAKNYNKHTMSNLLSTYFRLDYDYILEEGPTKLFERMIIAVNSLYTYMTGDALRIYSSSLVMIIILLFVFYQSTPIFLLLLTMIPVNYFGFKVLNRGLKKRSLLLQEETSSGWQKVLSSLSQTDYIKQCSSHTPFLVQFEPQLEKVYSSMANINTYAQVSSSFLLSLNQIAQTLIMVFVVYALSQHSLSSYGLILYTILVPLFFSNLSRVTNANLNKREMTTAMDFLSTWDHRLEQDGHLPLEEVREISFSLPSLILGDKKLSGPIEAQYRKGDIVWVKGASGTGKSTLMKLLPKFRPSEEIYINGIKLKDYCNSSLREKINYLSQQVPTIRGTLLENLFFGREYDQKHKDVLLHDPLLQGILARKDLRDEISEDGSNLSGGEKQKIALARILDDLGEVLILDEFTSNIDKPSAKEIYDRVTRDHGKRIIFIISHDDLPSAYANKELTLDPVSFQSSSFLSS